MIKQSLVTFSPYKAVVQKKEQIILSTVLIAM